jgi:hypothetical protein
MLSLGLALNLGRSGTVAGPKQRDGSFFPAPPRWTNPKKLRRHCVGAEDRRSFRMTLRDPRQDATSIAKSLCRIAE